MPVKRTPHHDLKAIQAKFADVDTLEITSKAARDAQKIGYSLEDIVDVVQALEPGDFIKSETAHNRRTIGCGTTPTTSPAMACGCI
jgi:motility quorum-sensing regulator/GCU-specific mRNA interferase toxin